jgi:two-component system cell cycle response regulator DivK
LAREVRPDLVLIDIRLPDIDGIEALRQIRFDRALDTTPVLAVWASVMPDEPRQIVASGFDAYMTKPINLKPFLEIVQHFLSSGHQQK